MARRRNNEQVDYDLHFILIGDQAVGKTSILHQFLYQRFTIRGEPATLACTPYRTTVEKEGTRKTVQLNISDTAGQERFRAIDPRYYRKAHGVLLVYDVTRRETFQEERISMWLRDIQEFCKENALIILIGNKSDMVQQREVTQREGMDYANNNNINMFMETSATSFDDVQKAFKSLVEGVCRLVDDNHFKNEFNVCNKI